MGCVRSRAFGAMVLHDGARVAQCRDEVEDYVVGSVRWPIQPPPSFPDGLYYVIGSTVAGVNAPQRPEETSRGALMRSCAVSFSAHAVLEILASAAGQVREEAWVVVSRHEDREAGMTHLLLRSRQGFYRGFTVSTTGSTDDDALLLTRSERSTLTRMRQLVVIHLCRNPDCASLPDFLPTPAFLLRMVQRRADDLGFHAVREPTCS